MFAGKINNLPKVVGVLLCSLVPLTEVAAQTPAECFANPSLCQSSAVRSAPKLKSQTQNTTSSRAVSSTEYSIYQNEFNGLSFEERRELQRVLSVMGLYSSSIDGAFGRGTFSALKQAIGNIDNLSGSEVRKRIQEMLGKERLPEVQQASQSSQGSVVPERELAQAQELIGDVEAFVQSGQSTFDISFAKKYADVSEVKGGAWSTSAKEKFGVFERYVRADPRFVSFSQGRQLERTRLAAEAIQEAKRDINENSALIKDWVQANLLDARSAAAVDLLSRTAENIDSDDLSLLEASALELDRYVSSLGIVRELISPTVASGDFAPDATYLFGNFSGRAKNIYKGISGSPEFDGGFARICLSGDWDQWQRYAVNTYLTDTLSVERAEFYSGTCNGSEDLLLLTGTKLKSGIVPPVFDMSVMEQLFVVERKDAIAAKQKLELISELYERDIVSGAKVGYGIIVFESSEAPMCLVVTENAPDHIEALQAHKKILSTYMPRDVAYEVSADAIDAFRKIQRKSCGSVYASSDTLMTLVTAAQNNSISYIIAPVWISNASLADIAEQRGRIEREEAALRSAQTQSAVLREQALAEAVSKALVLEEQLRAQHSVRFAALVDGLSSQVRDAVDFGFANSPLDKGYVEKYRQLSFLDPVSGQSSVFDPIIEDIQRLSLEKWEMTGFLVEKIDYGTVTYNGRELEGIISELKVSIKNRVVGDFQTYCRVVRAVQDFDFDMWRQVQVAKCSDDHSRWQADNDFQSRWIVAVE